MFLSHEIYMDNVMFFIFAKQSLSVFRLPMPTADRQCLVGAIKFKEYGQRNIEERERETRGKAVGIYSSSPLSLAAALCPCPASAKTSPVLLQM